MGISNLLNYGPTEHQGLRHVYLTRVKDGRFTPIIDWQKIEEEQATPGVTSADILLEPAE